MSECQQMPTETKSTEESAVMHKLKDKLITEVVHLKLGLEMNSWL